MPTISRMMKPKWARLVVVGAHLSAFSVVAVAVSAAPAMAQQAANPVEVYAYGQHNSAANPLFVSGGTVSTPDVTAVQPPAAAAATAGPSMCTQATASASLACKASAGNLYGVQATVQASTAAFWVLVINATAAPADGAVTPLKCFYVPANSTGTLSFPVYGPYFSTGITFVSSSTGCFTKTAVTTNFPFLSGDYR